ncbi:DHHA1 domain protein [uncultured archaeon]|nr:DHHA1 domain protein [uncultured archaeon]
MKKMKNLSYMEVTDSGASMVVNFVLGLSGKDVGVSYKLREEQGIYAVSIRGSKACKLHLGKIINQLATDLGGSGGGHDKACGAVIPKEKMGQFLKKFNSKLN